MSDRAKFLKNQPSAKHFAICNCASCRGAGGDDASLPFTVISPPDAELERIARAPLPMFFSSSSGAEDSSTPEDSSGLARRRRERPGGVRWSVTPARASRRWRPNAAVRAK